MSEEIDLYHVPGSQRVVPSAVANRYAYLRDVIIQRGTDYAAAMIEMWCAILEISRGNLWQAEFDSREEWVDSIAELGLPSMSRANIFDKVRLMNELIDRQGLTLELAAAAASTMPGASRVAAKSLHEVSGGKPEEYIKDILQLQPAEALGRIRYDAGQHVEMWFDEFYVKDDGTVLARIIRRDKDGYQAFDTATTIKPVKPEWSDKLKGASAWLVTRLRSGVQNASRTS